MSAFEVKFFEILDRGTWVKAIGMELASRNEKERFLMSASGYGDDRPSHSAYIALITIEGGHGYFKTDPDDWGDRTFSTAHDYIIKNWKLLTSGHVIDVEFLLGETKEKKLSLSAEYGAKY